MLRLAVLASSFVLLCTACRADGPNDSVKAGTFLFVPRTSVSLNTADKSAALSLFREVSTEKLSYLFQLKGSYDNGKGQLFSGESVGTGVSLLADLHFIYDDLGDYFFLRPSFGEDRYKTFLDTDPVGQQLKTESQDLRSLRFGASHMFRGGTLNGWLVGLTLGYAETTNGSKLDDGEFRKTTSVTTGSTSTDIVETTAVKLGRLEKNYEYPFSLDFLSAGDWIDKAQSRHLAYSFFLRKNLRSADELVPGFSVYLCDGRKVEGLDEKNKDPLSPAYGITFYSEKGKLKAGLTVGIRF